MLINFTHQPAYILHTRAYRDTSLLLEVYTEELGRIVAIARGVKRSKRPLTGLLQPFIPLSFSAKGRGDIVTMTAVEQRGMPLQLSGQRQVAGLYINELMVRLLERSESAPMLFVTYQNTLLNLQEQSIEISLRYFERRLIETLGYGVSFDITLADAQPIIESEYYTFIDNQGFIPATIQHSKVSTIFPGNILLKISREEYSCAESLLAAKKLFRQVLQKYLGRKPLMSRQLWLNCAQESR